MSEGHRRLLRCPMDQRIIAQELSNDKVIFTGANRDVEKSRATLTHFRVIPR